MFADIESFLVLTLKGTHLSKAANSEKELILTKMKGLQSEFPQLEWDINDRTNDVTKTPALAPVVPPTKVEMREKPNDAVKKTGTICLLSSVMGGSQFDRVWPLIKFCENY